MHLIRRVVRTFKTNPIKGGRFSNAMILTSISKSALTDSQSGQIAPAGVTCGMNTPLGLRDITLMGAKSKISLPLS
jgi:hypothetical protein